MADPRPAPPPASRLVFFGFDGHDVTPHAERMVAAGCGGVVLFARNVASPAQVASLSMRLKRLALKRTPNNRRLLVLIDQEGGRVQRIKSPATIVPAMRDVGASNKPPHAASQVGRVLGTELRAMGVDVNFAPVADVDTNPDNPVIGARAFSRDSQVVGGAAAAFVRTQQACGVAAVAKHRPGHGDTSKDTHVGACTVPHSLKRLSSVEFPPFAKAANAGVAGMLVAHVSCPALKSGDESAGVRDDGKLPATLSRGAVDALRRISGANERYRGVVFTDDMEMGAMVKNYGVALASAAAVAAGCDAILMCHGEQRQKDAIDSITDAAASGVISEQRMAEAHANLDALMDRYCAPPPMEAPNAEHVLTIVGSAENRRIVEALLRDGGK